MKPYLGKGMIPLGMFFHYRVAKALIHPFMLRIGLLDLFGKPLICQFADQSQLKAKLRPHFGPKQQNNFWFCPQFSSQFLFMAEFVWWSLLPILFRCTFPPPSPIASFQSSVRDDQQHKRKTTSYFVSDCQIGEFGRSGFVLVLSESSPSIPFSFFLLAFSFSTPFLASPTSPQPLPFDRFKPADRCWPIILKGDQWANHAPPPNSPKLQYSLPKKEIQLPFDRANQGHSRGNMAHPFF
jgi:hypothetical protein